MNSRDFYKFINFFRNYLPKTFRLGKKSCFVEKHAISGIFGSHLLTLFIIGNGPACTRTRFHECWSQKHNLFRLEFNFHSLD